MTSFFKVLFKNKIYEYYYIVFINFILLQLFFFPKIRLGLITSFLIIIVLIITIKRKDFLRNTFINKLILSYLFYNTISIVWFVFSGIPVSVFFAEWSNSILPIFFFYIANNTDSYDFKFYKITLGVIIFSFIIGFYLWVIEPPYYRVFLDTTEGVGTDMFFFESLFGLTATGAISVIGFLISARLVTESKGKKGKIAMLICIIASILTFRRSSMLVLFIAFFWMHYISYIKYKFLKKRYFLVEMFFVIVILQFLFQEYGDFLENIIERASMISEGFSERSYTWSYAFQDFTFLFGKGLGASGHKAIGYTKTLIADGNYFKMIAEIGIFGTLLFFAIIVTSVLDGCKNLKNRYLELGLVFAICLMGVGSNIFEYQSLIPIFWFSIGRVTNNRNLQA